VYILFILPIYIYIYCLCLPWDERAELDQLPENRKKGKKRHLLLGMRGRSSTNCQKTGKKEKKDTCCLG
jgi:hypothetical protein